MMFFVSCKKTKIDIPEKKVATIEKVIIEFGIKLNDFDVVKDTVKRGDSFGNLLEKQNLGTNTVPQIIEKVKDSINTRNIRIGKPYTILRTKDASKKIQYFIYQPDKISFFVVDFRDKLLAYNKKFPVFFKRKTIAARLDGSLSSSLAKLKVDVSIATKISKIYAWSIDFFKLKKGDKFAITFTEKYINDSIYNGIDDLEAMFFEYKGKMIYAFPFVQDTLKPKLDYYDENGNVLKNMFLKAPLKFINITSNFSKHRFHPVQQIWKAHNGTDYAAPSGTPIMATANGVVEQTGYTAGNGNFVKIKHNTTYSTQYLHMSKILVRRGQNISQGAIIGKVGSTGLATGPHVCYRFWYKGAEVDAKKLKLPNSIPIEERYKAIYFAQMTPLKKELDSVAYANFKN